MLWIKTFACLLPLLLPLVLDKPVDLGLGTFWYAAIFLSVLLGQILRPIPGVFSAILGILAVSILAIFNPELQSTVNNVVCGNPFLGVGVDVGDILWLLVVIFTLSLSMVKTGVARHLSYFLVSSLGKSTLGLGYAITILEACLAWFIPSSVVRSGGVVQPLVMGIGHLFNTSPTSGPQKLGAYLVWVGFASSCISSMLFLSACAANILALQSLADLDLPMLTWQNWLSFSLPTAVILLILTPLVAYWIYPPTLKDLSGTLLHSEGAFRAEAWTWQQAVTLVIFGLAIGLWAYGGELGLSLSVSCIGIVCTLFLTRVLSWDDLFAAKYMWSSILWFFSLYSLNYGLISLGFFGWGLSSLMEHFEVLTPRTLTLLLLILFFVGHYLFAGLTVQAAVILPMFLSTAASLEGMTPEFMQQLAILLMLSLGLMQVLTPYGSGQGLIWYASGYIRRGQFWFLGMVFGIMYLTVLLLITIPWFKVQTFFF